MDVFETLAMIDTIPEEEWNTMTGEHGKITKIKQLAFHDMIYFEDGHVEAVYIGD